MKRFSIIVTAALAAVGVAQSVLAQAPLPDAPFRMSNANLPAGHQNGVGTDPADWIQFADPFGLFDQENGITDGETTQFNGDGTLIISVNKSDGRYVNTPPDGQSPSSSSYKWDFNTNPTMATSRLRLWNAQTGQLIWEKHRSRGPDTDGDFRPDDQPSDREDEIEVGSFSPDDRYVAAAGEDDKIEIWRIRDVTTGALLSDPVLAKTFNTSASVDGMVYSHSGELLFAGTENAGKGDIFRVQGDPDTWQKIGDFDHGDQGGNAINSIDISQDDEYVATHGSNRVGVFWDLEVTRDGSGFITAAQMTRIATLNEKDGYYGSGREARFSNDGGPDGSNETFVIYVNERDYLTRVYSLEELKNYSGPANDPSQAPQPIHWLITGDKPASQKEANGTEVEVTAFTSDGRFFLQDGDSRGDASVGHSTNFAVFPGFFRIYETTEWLDNSSDEQPDPIWVERAMSTESANFSPDNARLASGHGDGTLRVWDVAITEARTIESEAFNETSEAAARWTLAGSRATPVAAKLMTTATGADGADAYIESTAPNSAKGATDSGRVRIKNKTSNSPEQRKTYLRFDLTAAPFAPDTVQNLVLSLFADGADSVNPVTIELRGILDGAAGDAASDWAEDAITFDNAPQNESGNGLGAQTTLLDTLTLAANPASPSDRFTFSDNQEFSWSSTALDEFVRDDTNGLVTFILIYRDPSDSTLGLKSKENASGNINAPQLGISSGPGGDDFGSNTEVPQATEFIGERGPRYLAIDNLGGEPHSLTLNAAWDIGAFTERQVQFAAVSAPGVFEAGDYLRLLADLDENGSFETTIAEFLPDVDGDLAWNGDGMKLNNLFEADDGTDFYPFQDIFVDLEPLLPTGFSGKIRFRVEAATDDSDEEIGFDSLRITGRLSDYLSWAIRRGLSTGVNDGFEQDPNQDGVVNGLHFAFDTNPLGTGSTSVRNNLIGQVIQDGGNDEYLTLSFPVRSGAVFSDSPLTSQPLDGLIYRVIGDDNLTGADLNVVERTTGVAGDNLPTLGDYDGNPGPDYEYRSFRLFEPISARPRGFLWVEVTEAP